jgi:hypothetical protein
LLELGFARSTKFLVGKSVGCFAVGDAVEIERIEVEDLSSGLDKRYPYCMQLHRLSAEQLRDCAFELARRLN